MASKSLDGKIIKGIGGFYYVQCGSEVYECKAKGIFRKKRITLLVGDNVSISVNENAENTVDEVYERKNSFVRPPVSNIDILAIVVSTCSPNPNYLVIDKLISIAEDKNIEPVLIVTKTDLQSGDNITEIYRSAGFNVFKSTETDKIKEFLSGKVTTFTGNSGVGKSTLLNSMDETLKLSTGEISEKLGRGRHTTRHAELYKVDNCIIADTPGFSSLDLEKCEFVSKENLPFCFREFRPYLNKCRFTSCNSFT